MALQDTMIIHKPARELPLILTLKSLFITMLTWVLWGYSIGMIYTYAQKIFTTPVLEQFFFHQVVAFMFIGSAILLTITIAWSFIAKSRRR
ncbi:HmsD [Glaesserella sp.]|uniref:HmsD n=1 Tax=Glaesserella sp. TaxID=2094731 RepID=UPI0035A034BD